MADPDFSDVKAGVSSTAQEATYTEYTVVKGDSLSLIAKRHYGDAKLWKKIFDANKDLVSNPDRIQIGWKLKLPTQGELHS